MATPTTIQPPVGPPADGPAAARAAARADMAGAGGLCSYERFRAAAEQRARVRTAALASGPDALPAAADGSAASVSEPASPADALWSFAGSVRVLTTRQVAHRQRMLAHMARSSSR